MTPMVEWIGGIIRRELVSLRKEIEAYPSDADLWKAVPGISNSGGTLALHLAGNLRHFIGGVLGGSGYRRNRDGEFATRDLSRADLVREVDDAIAAVERTFSGLSDAILATDYPEKVANVRVKTGDFLVHLESHLAEHLGQIDYHRRIATGSAVTVGTVSPARLGSAVPAEQA
jgi:hypothetical protein